MNQPFNPYQHNADVLRGFFRKPIVLITAISFCVPTITKLITSVATLMYTIPYFVNFASESDSGIRFSVRADLSPLLFGLAFLILFCTARSRKPVVNFKSPVTYLRAITIIFTVFAGIALAGALILLILLLVFNSYMPNYIFQSVLGIAIINAVGALADFMFYLALSRFSKGIKYSLTSVFITKAGSKFTAVTAFINVAVSVVSVIIGYIFLPSMLDVVSFLLQSFSDLLNINSVSQITNMISELIHSTFSLIIIGSISEIVPLIMVGIVAIMYFIYIRKTTDSLVLTPVDNEATRFYSEPTPEHNSEPQMPFNQNTNAPFVPPVMPESQPIENNFMYENPYASTPASSAPSAPQTPPQDFVPQPVFNNTDKAEPKSDEKICAHCGKHSHAEMIFCPYCGTKF